MRHLKWKNSSFQFQNVKTTIDKSDAIAQSFTIFPTCFPIIPFYGSLMLQLYCISIYIYLCFTHKNNNIFLPPRTTFLPNGGNMARIGSTHSHRKKEIAHILIFIKSSACMTI